MKYSNLLFISLLFLCRVDYSWMKSKSITQHLWLAWLISKFTKVSSPSYRGTEQWLKFKHHDSLAACWMKLKPWLTMLQWYIGACWIQWQQKHSLITWTSQNYYWIYCRVLIIMPLLWVLVLSVYLISSKTCGQKPPYHVVQWSYVIKALNILLVLFD